VTFSSCDRTARTRPHEPRISPYRYRSGHDLSCMMSLVAPRLPDPDTIYQSLHFWGPKWRNVDFRPNDEILAFPILTHGVEADQVCVTHRSSGRNRPLVRYRSGTPASPRLSRRQRRPRAPLPLRSWPSIHLSDQVLVIISTSSDAMTASTPRTP
jgi:hypothetical protein